MRIWKLDNSQFFQSRTQKLGKANNKFMHIHILHHKLFSTGKNALKVLFQAILQGKRQRSCPFFKDIAITQILQLYKKKKKKLASLFFPSETCLSSCPPPQTAVERQKLRPCSYSTQWQNFHVARISLKLPSPAATAEVSDCCLKKEGSTFVTRSSVKYSELIPLKSQFSVRSPILSNMQVIDFSVQLVERVQFRFMGGGLAS